MNSGLAIGIMECGNEASAGAEAALQHSKRDSVRLAPRPRRGAGGEGKRGCPLRARLIPLAKRGDNRFLHAPRVVNAPL